MGRPVEDAQGTAVPYENIDIDATDQPGIQSQLTQDGKSYRMSAENNKEQEVEDLNLLPYDKEQHDNIQEDSSSDLVKLNTPAHIDKVYKKSTNPSHLDILSTN